MIELTIAEAIESLKFLALFVLGVTVYAIFIFKFYKFIARKDIFELDLEKYNTSNRQLFKKSVQVIFYVAKYILLFPIFSFFGFGVLTVLLSFLSENSSIESILLISIALVGAVRVTSYYSEDLSHDLAKMLPFALLGIFLVDVSFFSIPRTIGLLESIPSHYNLLAYYLLFIIALEFILRLLYGTYRLIVPAKEVAKAKKGKLVSKG